MFDIGWQEIFIIGSVTLIVAGPKELPRIVRTVSGFVRHVRGYVSEFQDSIESIANETDIRAYKNALESELDTHRSELQMQLEENSPEKIFPEELKKQTREIPTPSSKIGISEKPEQSKTGQTHHE